MVAGKRGRRFFLEAGGGGGGTLLLAEIGPASPRPPRLAPRLWLLGYGLRDLSSVFSTEPMEGRFIVPQQRLDFLSTLLLDLRKSKFLPLLQCEVNRRAPASDVLLIARAEPMLSCGFG